MRNNRGTRRGAGAASTTYIRIPHGRAHRIGRNPRLHRARAKRRWQGLDKAGVQYDTRHGVTVDDFLRTTNPRIYAAGEVCMQHEFTHAADAAAYRHQNVLFGFLPKKRPARSPFRCVPITDRIAHVGLGERDAAHIRSHRHRPSRNGKHGPRDHRRRKRTAFSKYIWPRTDRIVGATLVNRGAARYLFRLDRRDDQQRRPRKTRQRHPTPTPSARKSSNAPRTCNRTRLTHRVKRITEWILARQR